jgi:L-ascorbate metabolism protein UlaG (beta-lactamase superfamily)
MLRIFLKQGGCCMMKVSYHGHSVVKMETNGKIILIDPFITGNELTDLKAENENPDVIILTHGHADHVGDTIEMAKRCNSLVVAPNELATYIGWQGVQTHPMHIGGSREFDFGKIKFTQAFHGSAIFTEDQQIIYLGMPAGVLFMAEGKTIYHAGDTALFSDMKLIGERHPIDLAFLPIGDNFTMGPEDAALAAEFLQAKTVVPIHYNTFPPIKQDPEQFIGMLKEGLNGKVMNPGDSIEL